MLEHYLQVIYNATIFVYSVEVRIIKKTIKYKLFNITSISYDLSYNLQNMYFIDLF